MLKCSPLTMKGIRGCRIFCIEIILNSYEVELVPILRKLMLFMSDRILLGLILFVDVGFSTLVERLCDVKSCIHIV